MVSYSRVYFLKILELYAKASLLKWTSEELTGCKYGFPGIGLGPGIEAER
jgi:hypothetical protein